MKINDIITEAPVGQYKTIGDFDKSYGFKSKRDRKMVSNPRYEQIVRKKFGKTEHDINLYFVNKKGVRGYPDQGEVDIDWVETFLGADVADAVKKHMEDSVNVIFTNNTGDQKVVMTPWIIAHRMAHGMARFEPGRNFGHRQFSGYTEANTYLNDRLELILEDVYGLNIKNQGGYGTNSSPKRDKLIRALAYEIGTFKSARDRKLRADFEFLHEMFAQYLIEGQVSLNDLPRRFKFGNEVYTVRDEEAYEELKELGDIERTFDLLFEWLLDEAENRIIVM